MFPLNPPVKYGAIRQIIDGDNSSKALRTSQLFANENTLVLLNSGAIV
jgi:hypothetical protein